MIVEVPEPRLVDGLDARGYAINWNEYFRNKAGSRKENMVRAKFKVTSIKLTEGSKDVLDEAGNPVKDEKGYNKRVSCPMHTVELYPVYGNGDPKHENTKFWQSSPSGKIELGTINAAAAEQFEIGREFYIDFTPA